MVNNHCFQFLENASRVVCECKQNPSPIYKYESETPPDHEKLAVDRIYPRQVFVSMRKR